MKKDIIEQIVTEFINGNGYDGNDLRKDLTDLCNCTAHFQKKEDIKIALALDSKRGNEKLIAKSIKEQDEHS